MVKKICPDTVHISDNVYDFTNNETHSLYDYCLPKFIKKDNLILKEKSKTLKSNADLEKEYDFIYGYCEIDNILFVDVDKMLSKSNDSIDQSNPIRTPIRLEPRFSLRYLNPKSLKCTKCRRYCEDGTMRNIMFDSHTKEIIKTAIVCIKCHMIYIFDGDELFFPIITISFLKGNFQGLSVYKPIKIPTPKVRN